MTTSDSDKTIANLLAIVGDLLRGKRHSRHTVASATGKSLTTADRWMKLIAEALPGASKRRQGKTSFLSVDVGRGKPSRAAALGACTAASLAALFEGTTQERNLRDARDWMLKESGETFSDLDRKFVFAPRGGEFALPEAEGELDEVFEAVLKHKTLQFSYRHNDGVRQELAVQPLSLLIFDHQFYVLARRGDGTLYCYRFARMTKVDATEPSFQYPPKSEYDPRRVLEPGFGVHIAGAGSVEEVEIVLSGPWANYAMSHKWHATQNVTPRDDGTVVVFMRVRICPEVETWALGFGEHAKVLRPARLRDVVASRVRKAAATYARANQGRPSVAKTARSPDSSTRRSKG